MRRSIEHMRFEIPDKAPRRIIDLGPIIEPPFTDGIAGEVCDSATDLTYIEYETLPEMPPADVAARARKIAQADPRVADALGRRWAFIGVGIVDHKAHDRPDLRVVWYTYDTDHTVEATTDDGGTKVHDVRVSLSQPPLTDSEEARANEIVASSDRLPEARNGRGILVEVTDRGDPRYHHRLVDLRFDPGGTRLPRWWAVVDLSTDEMVDAGDVPRGAKQ